LFFKDNVSHYDEDITDSVYFRALDKVTFENWFNRNYNKIDKPVLELGCGTGQQTVQIAKKSKDAVCLDISEEMVVKVKEKNDKLQIPGSRHFIVGDAEDPP